MLVMVINGAYSIFKVEGLIALTHDATSAENEAEPLIHKPLGLEKF